MESSPEAQPAPSGAPRPFAGPPGLSEEAIRSFTEIPPSATEAELEEEFEPDEMGGPQPKRPAAARAQQRPEYVVEPPDMLLVEVLEALPGRPISGERLVRPDGRISLGFYGEIPVAGLTLAQIKEKIVLHLRKFISDETLGLVEIDPETGRTLEDPHGRIVVRDPKDTDRVFVDVTLYNSQNYYILGDLLIPGRLPYTGGDSVLDAIQYGGGLLPSADTSRIRLIRSFPKGSPARVLPIDYEQITMGTDSSTNYPILPNDRLVVPRARSSRTEGDADSNQSTGEPPAQDARTTMTPARRPSLPTQGNSYFNRRGPLPAQNLDPELEKRIDALEKKLDRLIEVVEKDLPKPASEPGEISSVLPGIRGPLRDLGAKPAAARRMESPLGRNRKGEAERPGPKPPGPRRVGPVGPRPANAAPPWLDPERPPRRPPALELPESDVSPLDEVPPEAPPE